MAARDNNVQMPVYEALIYPVAGTDMTTESYQQNADAKPLNKPMMGWFVKYLINDDEDLQDPRLNIVGKADLQGLPPTTVITDEIDPLRSEGEDLAAKLKEAGVKVDAKTYSGVTHEFFGMGLVVSKAKDAESRVNSDLKSAFK
jgi:acetyl esterase/lipase